MSLVLKVLIKSLTDKKIRTFLVIFSIAVSAALIFANEGFSRTVEQRFYEADVRWGGTSDFYIESKDVVGAKDWVDLEKLSDYKDSFEYTYQFIKEKAFYAPSLEEMQYFNIIGVNINEFNHHNPIILSQGDFNDWSGFRIIIGKTYANINHLKLNDTMKLDLNGREYEFKIAGISEPTGLFLREVADGGFILVPKETLSQIYNGNSNLVFLKLKDSSQKVAMKDTLTKLFEDYKVEYAVDDTLIRTETANYVMPFRISTVVVVFMSMFIIFTAFNLITLERIPIVGTLRSVGCSRKKLNRILIIESACIGVVGGLAGCVLGLGVLQFIKNIYFSGEEIGLSSGVVVFGAKEIITAVLAAFLITTASAVLPILRMTKTPVKNIILNDVETKKRKRSNLWIVGCILLALCAVVPQFLQSSFMGMIIGCTLVTGALVGLVFVIPFFTYHLSKFLSRFRFLSHDIVLGIRNIRDNKSLLNSIVLFSSAIAIVAFMTSVFNTMGSDLLNYFDKNMNFNILMVLRHSDEQTLAKLSKVEGVEDCAGAYGSSVAIPNHQTFLNTVYGIEGKSFFDYNPVGQLELNNTAISKLNDGKNVITTNVMKQKFGLNIGDTLVIQFGSKEVNYTITGFVETNIGIGHVGYISAENYKEDMGVTDFDQIFVNVIGDADTVKNNIKRTLTKDVISIQTKKDVTSANSDKVMSVFKAISSYSYLAMLVGLIGIVNNLIASFIERKRSFAMYRCIGMSRKSIRRMLITEATGMGVLGTFFGLLCAIIMSSAIPVTVSLFWGQVTTRLAIREMAVMGIAGILAMLFIAAVPVMKSSRMSILESIKYE